MNELDRWKWRLECELKAIERVFRNSSYNSPSKTWGTILLFVSWTAIYVGTTFSTYPQPPYFGIFTGIVFLVIGRWWGIEYAWQQMGTGFEASHRNDKEYDRREHAKRRDED